MLQIIQATAGDQLAIARDLFKNYAASLDFDLDFQNFEQELNDLPGDYAPPQGQILIARLKEKTAGCVALRKFDQSCCEMKRLYVRPEFRGSGVGRALADAIIAQAREAGYAA
ncbi:MAG: GNAT family N-acetyltransferase, partial [Deltaproteobacteria bacterium]|nr:GNAT family N-acetyltransferase [Deltaproteobacteria bacterium]